MESYSTVRLLWTRATEKRNAKFRSIRRDDQITIINWKFFFFLFYRTFSEKYCKNSSSTFVSLVLSFRGTRLHEVVCNRLGFNAFRLSGFPNYSKLVTFTRRIALESWRHAVVVVEQPLASVWPLEERDFSRWRSVALRWHVTFDFIEICNHGARNNPRNGFVPICTKLYLYEFQYRLQCNIQ